MLRQAVFLCLLLAGMAKAQVDNYIISSIFCYCFEGSCYNGGLEMENRK